jgi:hypothetical protein
MNIFGKKLEEIAAEKPADMSIDILPGIPDRFSLAAAAFILEISEQTVMRMIQKGDLKQDEGGNITKDDLVGYIQSHTLADVPVLDNQGEGDEK